MQARDYKVLCVHRTTRNWALDLIYRCGLLLLLSLSHHPSLVQFPPAATDDCNGEKGEEEEEKRKKTARAQIHAKKERERERERERRREREGKREREERLKQSRSSFTYNSPLIARV